VRSWEVRGSCGFPFRDEEFAKGGDSVMEAGLGGSDGNFKDGRGFFERQVVLVAEEQDGSAGGGDEVEEGQEGFVR